MQHTILAVCAEPGAIAALRQHLDRRGYALRLATSAADGLTLHRDEGADLVILSLPLADAGGAATLRRLRAQDPRAVIVVTGKDTEIAGAPEALEHGAFEYLADPSDDSNALLTVIGISLAARTSDAQLRYLRKKDAAGADWQGIVGQCASMRQIFATVRQICHRTSTGGAPVILLGGETGTGKGLIAKAIHYNSVRRSRALVDVNCAALPPSLIEAELFGHAKGAFTDARVARAGLFETADGGTLFLDEISALPLELQTKLLTVIEEKRVRPVGSSQAFAVDVQLIAASNRDLASMVEQRLFRADLFHRLNVINLRLPPLRERGEDRVLLAEAFLAKLCRDYGIPEKKLADDAKRAIEGYAWPGNVRELRNQLERVALLEDDEVVHAQHLSLAPAGGNVSIESDGGALRVKLPEGSCSLEGLERAVIRQALDKHQGNVSKTARYLGISRDTLNYRLKKHGMAEG